MMPVKVLFWLSAALIAYTYAGYHLLLGVLAWFAPRRAGFVAARKNLPLPSASVIVAAYNEERVIAHRIENLLGLDYPRDKLQIVVASDGSTDGTARIAERYGSEGVTVLDLPRAGKALAQNAAAARCSGELIVFTDADSEFDPGFLKAAVASFDEDPRVGCVVGNLSWRDLRSGNAVLKGWYWRFETSLRCLESRLGILAGGTGAGMVLRRSLWRPMTSPLDDTDSVTPLHVVDQGYRVVFAPDARVTDEAFALTRSEYGAKIRGVSKTVDMIWRHWGVRGCVAHPVITWRLVSHHFLRWVSPLIAVVFLVCSALLWRSGGVYTAAAAGEVLLLAIVAVGYVAEKRHVYVSIASPLYSFAAVNAGMGVGFFKAVFRRAKGLWETE